MSAWVSLGIAALVAVLGCGRPSPPRAPARPPLILLFSFDTLRADHLSCYGYERPTSPALDALAADGVLFTRAISQAPLTAPSHATMLTSLTPLAHRVNNPNDANPDLFYTLADAIPTLPGILRDHGYRTVGITGGGVLSSELGFDRGFDDYSTRFFFNFSTYYFQPEPVLDSIRAAVSEAGKNKRPLFLFLHHYLCHDPYIQGPPEYMRKFLDRPVPGLPLGRADLLPNPDPAWGAYDEGSFWRNIDFALPGHLEHTVALYDGSIRYADYVFGRVMEILREASCYDPALIIVTSDHGEEFNEHGGKLHCRLFIEHLHVPLIVKLPGNVSAGTTAAAPVQLLDIMPTILDYLGLPRPALEEGVSLLPVLEKRGEVAHPVLESYVLSYRRPDSRETTVTARLEKGGYAYSDLAWKGEGEWLFDVGADPREMNNLAGERPGILADLKTLAGDYVRRRSARGRWFEEVAKPRTGLSDDVKRQLKALGYIGK
jgi:arylsulfatase A-like enzyme